MKGGFDLTYPLEKAEIKSIGKGLIILNYISNNNSNITLSNIAEDLKMPKSTVSGILKTLEQFEFIEKNKNNEYQLGTHLFKIGMKAKKSFTLVSEECLQELADKVEDTVNLGILSNGKVLIINKFRPKSGLQIGDSIGASIDPHCVGLGKVLLSNLSENDVENIIAQNGLKDHAPNTITNIDDLKIELNKVRKQGYAIDNEEYMEDMKCIAAPIYNANKENIAAISITTLISRLNEENLSKYKELLLEYSSKISKKLGNTTL